MAKPGFELVSLSDKPEDKSCVATWVVDDVEYSATFLSSFEAFKLNDLIRNIYTEGYTDGEYAVVDKLRKLIREY